MQIDRDTLQELREFQEDCAVECLAIAKLAELRGELVADEV
jgi:hypothetical protein